MSTQTIFPYAILTGLAFLTICIDAYEAALYDLSGSRLKELLEEDGLPEPRFLQQLAERDPQARLSASLWDVLSFSVFFLFYGLIWVMPLLHTGGDLPIDMLVSRGLIGLLLLLCLKATGTLAVSGREEEYILQIWRPAKILNLILTPVVRPILFFNRIALRSLGIEEIRSMEDLEEEVIAAVSDGELAGVVEGAQREMIESIMDFKDADIADIMTPRTEMVSIDISETDIKGAINLALESGHSRIPVYQDTRDNIIGIFHVRAALAHWGRADDEAPALKELLVKPMFVPETKKVTELLPIMQRGRSHMVVVLDEYGGTAGLATIEDILEEIVGDIQDEYDVEEPSRPIQRMGKDAIVAEAHEHVRDINEALDEDIIPEDDDYETLGGFVLDNLGHIPKPGESFTFKSLHVEVLSADERRVGRVRVRRDREAEDD